MESDHVAAELDDGSLSLHLEAAQRELEALSELVADVPVLMETRFKRELGYQLALNQSLAQERNQLSALIGAVKHNADSERSGPKLPRLSRISMTSIERHRRGHLFLRKGFLRGFAHFKRRKLLFVIGGTSAALGLSLLVLRAGFSPDPPSRVIAQQASQNGVVLEPVSQASVLTYPVDGSPESLIELNASDATWVEVSDRQGQPLLQDTLNAGDQRRIRLRDGLELYAARPELLRFRVDEGPWQAFPDPFLNSGLVLLTPQPR